MSGEVNVLYVVYWGALEPLGRALVLPGVTRLAELDPIYDVHALPFAGDSFDARYLALLVKLRPTSHRDVVLVYDPSARLVYEEILERQGSLWTCVDRAAAPERPWQTSGRAPPTP